ncbi:hypothetical protein ABTZ59_20650 [Streptomyces sp. NPDC094034]|uniref:hypothetical protein n=1 Tax=Streptomyces sp. NPDC094034 TaxID=3155309 RepID=UPI00331CA84F
MSGIRVWESARRRDKPTAVIIGAGNLLMSSVLFLMMIGTVPFYEITTREQETAAQHTAIRIFGGWLAAGLVLFLVLGMRRTALSHLTMMLVPPAALILILLLLAQ